LKFKFGKKLTNDCAYSVVKQLFSTLTNLTNLAIGRLDRNDFQGLTNLTNLRKLYVTWNKSANFPVLDQLKVLRAPGIMDSYGFLAKMTRLVDLDLKNSPFYVYDLCYITELTNLKRLVLNDSTVANSMYEKLPKLKTTY